MVTGIAKVDFVKEGFQISQILFDFRSYTTQLKITLMAICFERFKHFEIIRFHLISLQRNNCIFVKKSRVNFAQAKYTYHFEILKSFKTICRLS